MKLTLRVVCIVLCTGLFAEAAQQGRATTPAAAPQGRSTNPANAALTQIEQDWANAMIKSDIPKLQSIFADSLVYVLAAGGVQTTIRWRLGVCVVPFGLNGPRSWNELTR